MPLRIAEFANYQLGHDEAGCSALDRCHPCRPARSGLCRSRSWPRLCQPIARFFVCLCGGLGSATDRRIRPLQVFISPCPHSLYQRFQGFTCFGKGVFHFGGHHWINLSDNQPILLKLTQLSRKNARAEIGLHPVNLAETEDAIRHQVVQDDSLPFAANDFKASFDAATAA
jgi:hypothetical protein